MTKTKAQSILVTVIPEPDVPLRGEGSVEWQLSDLLLNDEHPDFMGETIDAFISSVELVCSDEDLGDIEYPDFDEEVE